MKFGEYKQELSEFWLSPGYNAGPIGESTHIKTMISLVPNTGQHLHANWFHKHLEREFWVYWDSEALGGGGGSVDSFLNTSPTPTPQKRS
jgi:hypothetical protein